MTKTILITGSTDGLGLATAQALAANGHSVLLHGRSQAKLDDAEQQVRAVGGTGQIDSYRADLSDLDEVAALASAVMADHPHIDVLINNAGVFRTPKPTAPNGLDIRFVVNTIAPYLLTRQLMPALGPEARVINLSSAAQAPVDPDALLGRRSLDDSTAYAQSKLALTMWSNHLAARLGADGPAVIAVNPGSFLGTKMVKEAYGSSGKDIGIGADILTRAATSEEFAAASGRYFDNDSGRFANPHPDALDPKRTAAVVDLIDSTIATLQR
ncbi:MAG: SDR family NAD(P)-dependent oxidoreductase [Actinomycetota bacterium]